MNRFEKRLHAKIEAEIPRLQEYTPGLVIDVHRAGRRVMHLELGRTYTFYDLASLTKILFTGSLAMMHFDGALREMNKPVAQVLPWWRHRATTPKDLMTHTAGLEWWRPFFKKMKGSGDPQARWVQMEQMLAQVKPQRRQKAVYSDLDLFLFSAYLQERQHASLEEQWEKVSGRLDVTDLFFHPANKPKYARARYAPTTGRNQGVVDDENARGLGGLAPHAGLFGTAEAVSEWGLKLRKAYRGGRSAFGDPETVRYFCDRRVPAKIGDWGLVFMKPTKGGSSCGQHFHVKSFGHTGFTGTSFWYDPVQDLQVVILSNRVHPTRENKKFVALRPLLHDWICQALD